MEARLAFLPRFLAPVSVPKSNRRRGRHGAVPTRASRGSRGTQSKPKEKDPRAQRSTDTSKTFFSSFPTPKWLKKKGERDVDVEEAQEEGWDRSWNVPWGGPTLALGTVLWLVAYVSSAAFAPLLVAMARGKDISGEETLSLAILVSQLGQAAGTVGALSLVTRGELFKVLNFAPWKLDDGWIKTALSAIPLAVVSVAITAIAASAFGVDRISGGGSTEVVAQTLSTTPATSTALLLTCSVFAPWTEEIFFRGFVLTTLTKWMPVPWAIVSSAALFSAAHLTPRDAPQLFALGIVLGLTYAKSRNLAAPMAIHGIWNGSVFSALLILVASGIDLNEFLSGQASLDWMGRLP
eukprot:scaffold271_cov336-Pavlova_lutheri.AAC.31